MKTRLLIRNGHVIDPGNKIDQKMDVYVENGKIVEVAQHIDYYGVEITIIEADGMVVAPGLFDMHCHLRDPGYTYKEDMETGTAAAAMGGFTSIACMPNTKPVADNATVIKYILERAAEVGRVNVYPIGAISAGLKGEWLASIGDIKLAGAVAVSDDGRPVENAMVMRRAMQYASMFNALVISHAEDTSLSAGGCMNEGLTSTKMGLIGIPNVAEEVMVARDCLLAKSTGTPVHIAHVSTANSVEIIRFAKKNGVRVTAETCPHYFSLTDTAARGYDTNAKMSPPLRAKKDVDAIIQGLVDGTIDVIATDHAPHSADEKNCEFDKALNGIIGFETALPLALTYLVKPGHLTVAEVIEKMSLAPARILGIGRGTLGAKRPGDIVIFNPNEPYTVDISKFKSKSKNSPYNGFKLWGKPQYTIVDGKVVVRCGELM